MVLFLRRVHIKACNTTIIICEFNIGVNLEIGVTVARSHRLRSLLYISLRSHFSTQHQHSARALGCCAS